MEGFPFRLSLSLILAAVVVGLSFYMITSYLDAQVRQKFAQGVNSLQQQIDNLNAVGDYGSFQQLKLTVPSNCYIQFNRHEDKFAVNFFSALIPPQNISANLTWDTTLPPGEYTLTLVKTKNEDYRVNVTHLTNGTAAYNATIGFK